MTEVSPSVGSQATLIVPRSPVVRNRGRAIEARLEAVVMEAYDAHERDLHAFARALVRDAHEAEDVVADAFLRLVREVRAGRQPDNVRGWLYRVTANLVLSRGRRLQTAKRLVGSLIDRRTEESPEARFVRDELGPDLVAALQALSPPMRVAIVMAARGASGRQIADALRRSEVATRAILMRARSRLRARLSASSWNDHSEDRA